MLTGLIWREAHVAKSTTPSGCVRNILKVTITKTQLKPASTEQLFLQQPSRKGASSSSYRYVSTKSYAPLYITATIAVLQKYMGVVTLLFLGFSSIRLYYVFIGLRTGVPWHYGQRTFSGKVLKRVMLLTRPVKWVQ